MAEITISTTNQDVLDDLGSMTNDIDGTLEERIKFIIINNLKKKIKEYRKNNAYSQAMESVTEVTDEIT